MDGPYSEMETPLVVVDLPRLKGNITSMQSHCREHGVALWPHIKTHKCVEIARLQLEAGAAGLTCAKLSEAEAMLSSGVRRFFIAYPLVDPLCAPRLQRLAESLDELVLAVTSVRQAHALGAVLEAAAVDVSVMVGVDTGLGREGVRNQEEVAAIVDFLSSHPRMELKGIFTHEGQLYTEDWSEIEAAAEKLASRLVSIADQMGGQVEIWPGCSVTARLMAMQTGVTAVRPGAYVFGDLMLCSVTKPMEREAVALQVVAKVVDFPEENLALIDAGTKTFSSDRTVGGIMAEAATDPRLQVRRCNEEHGYLTWVDGAGEGLELNQRLVFIPAHVCTVVNLTDTLQVMEEGRKVGEWRVAARGRTI